MRITGYLCPWLVDSELSSGRDLLFTGIAQVHGEVVRRHVIHARVPHTAR